MAGIPVDRFKKAHIIADYEETGKERKKEEEEVQWLIHFLPYNIFSYYADISFSDYEKEVNTVDGSNLY